VRYFSLLINISFLFLSNILFGGWFIDLAEVLILILTWGLINDIRGIFAIKSLNLRITIKVSDLKTFSLLKIKSITLLATKISFDYYFILIIIFFLIPIFYLISSLAIISFLIIIFCLTILYKNFSGLLPRDIRSINYFLIDLDHGFLQELKNNNLSLILDFYISDSGLTSDLRYLNSNNSFSST
jgi:hypothetical protein